MSCDVSVFPSSSANKQLVLSHLQPYETFLVSQSTTAAQTQSVPASPKTTHTHNSTHIHTTLTSKSHNLARRHIHNVSNCRPSCPACCPPGRPAPGQAILRHANHAQRRSLFRASSLPAPTHRREPPSCRLGQAVQARRWTSCHVSHIATPSSSQARKLGGSCHLTTCI